MSIHLSKLSTRLRLTIVVNVAIQDRLPISAHKTYEEIEQELYHDFALEAPQQHRTGCSC
jgi:hypothetical protein